MRRPTTLFAFALTALCLDAVPADGQSTNQRTFRARSNASGTSADCTFRARSDSNQTTDRRIFRARPRSHALAISAVNGVSPSLTNADVDDAFAAASTLLQAAQNPPADVACCVSVTRDGNLGNFAQPAGMVGGVISNRAERDAVAAIGDDLMVVNGITFCAGTGNSFSGCQTGGAMILIRARITVANAATIAHELGHREGLCHTNGCPCGSCGAAASCSCAGGGAATRDIMFCSACPGRDTITASECGNYQANANR